MNRGPRDYFRFADNPGVGPSMTTRPFIESYSGHISEKPTKLLIEIGLIFHGKFWRIKEDVGK